MSEQRVARPYRALPPGMQYTGIDKPGGKACQRRLRQARRQELKQLRKEFKSDAVQGRDADGALILDFPAPARANR